MSSFPDSKAGLSISHTGELWRTKSAVLATVVAVLGLATIWPTMLTLWTMWTTDALKSIGMVIPVVSLVLILRAGRRLGGRVEGTWWGLPLILAAIVASWVEGQQILVLAASPTWSTVLPPPALVLFLYGSGAVLFLGGTRLYAAAVFPIVLLCFANPVPHMFSSLVDIPLQRISAHITRGFAMALGQALTPDRLRLMFTPDFGMFIAPGCDGIRGSVTMGFVALIAAYIYRFRWYATALVVAGAIALGYLFNLVRLCLLVLYYVLALHVPSLQNKAENADYLIGAVLFLIATVLLFTVIQHLRDAKTPIAEEAAAGSGSGRFVGDSARSRTVRLATLGVIALFGCLGLARAAVTIHASTQAVADPDAQRFPQRLGDYTLVRSWKESLTAGAVVYVWGQYTRGDGDTPIAIGISPVAGWHDPLICHSIRGDNPVWQGQLMAGSTGFSSAFYNDGVTQSLEASTVCSNGSCGEFAPTRTRFGLIYGRPNPRALLGDTPKQTIRVLLRVETLDVTMAPDSARQLLAQDLRAFLASARLDDLVQPYSR